MFVGPMGKFEAVTVGVAIVSCGMTVILLRWYRASVQTMRSAQVVGPAKTGP